MQLLTGSHVELPIETFSRLSTYRYEVFCKKLGWQLNVTGDEETDQFDRADTLYVVAKNDLGNICGCARLLPTTKPYLLGRRSRIVA